MGAVRTLALMAFVGLVAAQSPSPARPTLKEWNTAKDDVAAEAAAVKAKEKKMAAVQKVISLLEGLKNKVLAEGEAEAQTYNKFACFCKDTTAAKTSAISTGEDEKAALSASIETYAAERDNLDQTIQTLTTEIAAAEKRMKIATAERAATLATYEKNDADLRAAIDALEGALASLKSSKAPSFAQIQAIADTVGVATTLADAMGLDKGSKVSLLSISADPEVAMEDYKFHSDDIITTLEKLMEDFRAEKTDVDAAEVNSVKVYEELMQKETDFVKAHTKALEDSKKNKATKQEEIAMASSEVSSVAATLLDDKQYLRELSDMCSEKASTWDQRTKVRQDELSALTAALGIVSATVTEKTTAATMRLAQQVTSVKLAEVTAANPRAMEEIEAEAEAADNSDSKGPGSFFQRASTRSTSFLGRNRLAVLAPEPSKAAEHVRRRLADMLKGEGQQLKSALLTSLASHVAEDPFAKVKTLIQELIERLLTEAAHDSNQKDWCDKSISDAEQKRTYAEEAVEKHNAAMAVLESKRDKLSEELGVLGEEIKSIEDSREEAEALRAADKSENEITVSEATEGLVAVDEAVKILDQFYKTVAKESVDLSLAQRGPAEDAPDAGFKIGEAYTGAQGVAGGILGMMDVIKSDFQRTIAETEKAEIEAQQDHLKFMTESGKSLKQKEVAAGETKKQLDVVEEKLADEDEGLSDQMDALTTAVKELMELKPACIDTGMSYADRVSRRDEEIEALKKGLCILDHYSEYGPESTDTC